jgi:hypothetical protein
VGLYVIILSAGLPRELDANKESIVSPETESQQRFSEIKYPLFSATALEQLPTKPETISHATFVCPLYA